MTREQIGKAAYEAYCDSWDSQDAALPGFVWSTEPPKARAAWIAAAEMAIKVDTVSRMAPVLCAEHLNRAERGELEPFEKCIVCMRAEKDQLLEALRAYAALDDQRMACEECEDQLEQAPEACGLCFPFADDARLKMRNALGIAQPEETA